MMMSSLDGDRVDERLPREELQQIFPGHGGHLGHRSRGRSRGVRSEYDVRNVGPPRGGRRLFDEDIQGGHAEAPGMKSLNQGLLVDQRSARDIDQQALRAERRENLSRYQTAIVISGRSGDDEDIALAGEGDQVR